MIPLRDLNPRRGRPVVTVLLIAVNAVLFIYELSLGAAGLDRFLLQAAFIPAKVLGASGPGAGLDFGLGSALLSMFLHGGLLHFLGNMLFLWVFGDNVEDRLGHWRFVVFYVACGFAATTLQALSNPSSTIPTIGASGAIAGVLGAYLFLFPRARIVTLFWLGIFVTTVQVPALLYLVLWFVMQFFSGLISLGSRTSGEGGVAWFAHIGGFLAGPLLLWIFGVRRTEPRPPPRLPW